MYKYQKSTNKENGSPWLRRLLIHLFFVLSMVLKAAYEVGCLRFILMDY